MQIPRFQPSGLSFGFHRARRFGSSLLTGVCISTLGLAGCGRLGPPLTPEILAPRTVKNLIVTPLETSVKFDWEAPEDNRNNEKLKEIDGYFIGRKVLVKRSDMVDPEVPFKTVATIPDTHMILLTKLQDKAREEKTPLRKVKIDEALTRFTFEDKDVTAGSTYAYKIIPFYKGDVKGEVKKIVKVLFKGLESEVTMLDNTVPDELDG